ncbi:DUF2946 family protein [Mitsuaria sp. GD03876]|uniref:DUF2946 family protein n=1 Tax=Mitsuaria sp. GD03876 TaxID=2975399 RepID=UPI0024491890|nr:DUF2946 family protein [Mitsuaria sp. GD03876]MDH0865753.1 DUF2946 family protein [Mitsuaria sp. GD03876]
MQATRTSIKRLAWLVVATILLAAMLPSLSHAVLAKQGATYAEICSATGAKFVLVDLGADAGADAGNAPAPTKASMDCPYCAIHHGAPALPPAPVAWTPPDALKFAQPRLFLTAPRPLFAWAPSLARGPPVLA